MKVKIVFGNNGKNLYYVDGKELTKEEFDLAVPSKGVSIGACPNTLMQSSEAWPRKSESLGVMPSQVEAAKANSIKIGVPTEFNKEGQAIMRDNAHQKAYLKAMGYVNFDGMYGQATS
jgi:hypothetical protein